MRTALICGVSGQDGAYLSRLLLAKGYRVIGTSRDAQVATFANLRHLGIKDAVECVSMVLTDFRSTLQTLARWRPDEIYNLSGQSSVGLSFEQPVEAVESITIGVLNLLEAVRFLGLSARIYNASSSECFGETSPAGADEMTAFRPCSPYAVAKSAAHLLVVNYRQAYGVWASNGILFNHESPLRPERFVTRKIVAAACRIKAGTQARLRLGDTSISRDWGWAEEYVDGMWRILQYDRAEDFILATGESNPLSGLVAAAFAELGLDWRDHVEVDAALSRPSDIRFNRGNADKAKRLLDWSAQRHMRDVVRAMIAAELSSAEREASNS